MGGRHRLRDRVTANAQAGGNPLPHVPELPGTNSCRCLRATLLNESDEIFHISPQDECPKPRWSNAMSFEDDVRQRRQAGRSASAFAGLAKTAIASGKAEAKAAATKEAQKRAKAAAVLPRSRKEAERAQGSRHETWNQRVSNNVTARILDDLYGPGNWSWHWETKRFGDTQHYFTGKPCKLGHVAKRRTEDGVCVACDEGKKVVLERKAAEEPWFAELVAKRGEKWFRRFSLESIQNWRSWEDYRVTGMSRRMRKKRELMDL